MSDNALKTVSAQEDGAATGEETKSETSIDLKKKKAYKQKLIDNLDESLNPLTSDTPYNTRKNAAQASMDASLMFANISQLRTLISSDNIESRDLLIVMVSFSLSFQFLFAIIILIVWVRESHRKYKEEYLRSLEELADDPIAKDIASKILASNKSLATKQVGFRRHRINSYLNFVTLFLILFITVANIAIASTGIRLVESTKDPSSQESTSIPVTIYNMTM